MKLFWPAIGKDFSGVVLGYDAPSKNHTVRWDNAPGGSSGVTEVCIDEGVVTWLAPPEGSGSLAAGGGSSKGGSSSKQQKTPEKKKDKDGGAPKEAKPPKEVSKETLEEVQARIGSGTIKGICFRVLKNAGAHGMLLSEIVETTQKLGLKDWTSVRQPSNTVNACCSGDPAFVKVAPGRVGLACLGAAESPDLAAREEREHGEKVLYCEACRGGPFNTKGMRMHISRWCAYAPGNAKEHEGRVPRAVTDKAAAAIDNAAAAQAAAERDRANANKNAEAKGKGGGGAGKSGAKGGGGGGGGGGDDGSQVKTLACELCGAGPFNDKGMAMHASRWCKARPDDGGVGSLNPFSALGFGSPLDGGLASAFGGSRKRKKSEKQEDEFNPATLFPASPPKSAAPGSFSTGMDLAAMFNNLVPPIVGGGGGSGAAGGGGGFARGLMDMMARTLSGGAFSGAFSGGFSGGVLGGGQVVNQTKSDAEQPEPQEMKVDVEVYKDDGTFVARAPLVVPVDVTLMGLKLAVEDNTKGALPPHRQLLKKDGVPFPEGEEEKPLREFVGGDVSGKINLHLTIVDD